MATIPRFLLPQRGLIWRPQQQQQQYLRRAVRFASTRQGKKKAPGSKSSSSSPAPPPPPPSSSGSAGGHVLAQPTKFNPPSHGARLPRAANNRAANAPPSNHYGGDLSAAEQQAQRVRQYPGMMAPPGTWAHWFWTSRVVHLGLTMSLLTALALYTGLENFRRTSPFVDLLPTAAEAAAHPLLALRTTVEVVRLTEQQRQEEMTTRRQQRVDDVAKRTQYRKAHGLDETVGFASSGGWWGRSGTPQHDTKAGAAAAADAAAASAGPVPPARNEPDVAADNAAATATEPIVDDASPVRGAAAAPGPASGESGKRKGWFGGLL
ncbi:hypothetical protein SPI_00990 [Niveomyces insectorum RCEF 264]|uniref:Uncharacterized protein n=1 Tax=Niveomyces insectorum RCEF 264 TaxID=1081102 RepID=A0A168AIF3_9HYPO|nr:hypothetical protein SPI_00990 [Niveomyces insectorum RCEF 264]